MFSTDYLENEPSYGWSWLKSFLTLHTLYIELINLPTYSFTTVSEAYFSWTIKHTMKFIIKLMSCDRVVPRLCIYHINRTMNMNIHVWISIPFSRLSSPWFSQYLFRFSFWLETLFHSHLSQVLWADQSTLGPLSQMFCSPFRKWAEKSPDAPCVEYTQ